MVDMGRVKMTTDQKTSYSTTLTLPRCPFICFEKSDTEDWQLNGLLRCQQSWCTLMTGFLNPVLVLNADTSVTYVNPAWECLTGFDQVDVIGIRAPYPWWPEEVSSSYLRCLKAGMREGVKKYEVAFRKKDGEYFWVEITSVPVLDKKKLKVYISNWVDITERKRAEEELKLRAGLLDLATDAVFLCDVGGNFIYVNEAAQKLYGYSKDEFMEMNPHRLVAPEQAHSLELLIKKLLKEGSTSGETVHLCKDGSRVPVEVRARTIKSGDRNYILGIARDITERERAEEELKLRAGLLDLATDAILVFDLEGNIVYASEAAYLQRGYTREEMTKMNLRQVVSPERVPFIMPRMNEVRKKGRAFFETAHLRKDGSRIQVESHIRFIKSGEREFVLSVSRDITERKRAEEERRKAEEKLRLIFNSVTDGIVVTDLKGRLTEVNKVAVRMHGFDNETDPVGQRAFKFISRGDHAGVLENLKETLGAGYSGVMEYSLLSRDGGEFPAELSTSVLRDERGSPVGFVALTRDITERKRREQQLLLTDRLASIGELVSGIVHELNNPLTGIVGFSQLLLRGNVPEDIREDITTIYNESQRAVRIVRSLLNFARKHEPVKQLVNVNTIVENVLELRSYEHRVHNILVEKKMALELPGILADSSLLQQVFFNIAINAEHSMIAAHQRGKLVITTDKVGSMLRISFADDGLGISKENQECIFNSFFTTKEAGKGTGLGLSICRSIVTRHGGRIYVESELGKGSNFIVELPFHR